MKTFLLILTINVFALSPGYSQTETRNVSADQQIMKLMNDWMRALMKKDIKTLDKLMAPEFTISNVSRAHFDGRETLKEGWMNNIDHLKVDSVHYTKMKVYVVDNVAVVKSMFYFAGSRRYGVATPDPGQNTPEFTPFVDSTTILVDTWLKRKQGWQVINRLRVDDPQLYKFERQNILNKPLAPARAIRVSETILQRYVGEYQLRPKYILTITKEQNQLFAQLSGHGKEALVAETETKFRPEPFPEV